MTPRQAGIAVPVLPKDLTDLQLAPLVLTVDRRLDELDLLDLRELLLRVGFRRLHRTAVGPVDGKPC